MSDFCRNMEELIPKIAKYKHKLYNFVKKNFKQAIHYITVPIIENPENKIHIRGGNNKVDVFLTEEAFELLKNSYNIRNRNIIHSLASKSANIIIPIECQTIGFIENAYSGVIESIRQYKFGNYRVDMYFPKYKIILECDEFDHKDRDVFYEKKREQYLLSLGNTIIRYDPNERGFNISDVLREINKIIMIDK